MGRNKSLNDTDPYLAYFSSRINFILGYVQRPTKFSAFVIFICNLINKCIQIDGVK